MCVLLAPLQDPGRLLTAVIKVICDFDVHFIDEHKQARKHSDWLLLRSEATLTSAMADILWQR